MTETYSGLEDQREYRTDYIHRQPLACKPSTLSEAVKVVNFMKSRATNSRLFRELCEYLASLHVSLLLHTEVSWLSRCKVLTRLFELKSEVQAFLLDHPFHLSVSVSDILWIQTLAYLADIFSELNELSMSLQSPGITIFNVHDRTEAMLKKANFWKQCLQMNDSFLSENKIQLNEDIKRDITDHLKQLQSTFKKYFPNKPGSNN
ncbi:unnamed protein product [Acanthoscelides obtectus]|uniref:Zinc finger BED domain-containing protein 5 n=1 Tax=Acanthoscelides obtectus TaxID=200917 RepID=A0A9P0L8J8_ACAOB|nr:unnamed protein product [Acanthoscelides obtectus]CAK1653626.1 Zinc finger BED domain-containing protein 5 [Acanthoscelides obtectus]